MSTKPGQQHNTNDVLAITAYGLQAATGNQDFALFGAIATMLTAASEDSVQEVPSPTGDGYDPALTAPIVKYSDLEPEIRMQVYLQNALVSVTEHLLTQKLEQKNHLLLIVLPASVFDRSYFVNTAEWQELLTEQLSPFPNMRSHFVKADSNVTKQLQNACAALNEGKVDSVIFAGSDSLLGEATYAELLTQNRLCSSTISNGVLPGEAAACVLIQKISSSNTQSRAILRGFSTTAEPNSGKAHLKQLTGLSQVIQSVSQMAQQHPDNLDCIIRSSTTEQQSDYEWYQTCQRLWPNTLPEQQRVAFQTGELDEPPKLKPRKMPEELNVCLTLGEIGAASIPLGLVLACARFDFNYPAVKNCIVYEANDFPFRGAILLDNPHPGSQTTAQSKLGVCRT